MFQAKLRSDEPDRPGGIGLAVACRVRLVSKEELSPGAALVVGGVVVFFATIGGSRGGAAGSGFEPYYRQGLSAAFRWYVHGDDNSELPGVEPCCPEGGAKRRGLPNSFCGQLVLV